MRGLKHNWKNGVGGRENVAPLTGAWIETSPTRTTRETARWSHPSRVRGLKHPSHFSVHRPVESHPSRVRGLKHFSLTLPAHSSIVAPLTGAWIETPKLVKLCPQFESHPSRVRGLKQYVTKYITKSDGSHPSRVRGLKQAIRQNFIKLVLVAPLTGAWIETSFCRI